MNLGRPEHPPIVPSLLQGKRRVFHVPSEKKPPFRFSAFLGFLPDVSLESLPGTLARRRKCCQTGFLRRISTRNRFMTPPGVTTSSACCCLGAAPVIGGSSVFTPPDPAIPAGCGACHEVHIPSRSERQTPEEKLPGELPRSIIELARVGCTSTTSDPTNSFLLHGFCPPCKWMDVSFSTGFVCTATQQPLSSVLPRTPPFVLLSCVQYTEGCPVPGRFSM